MNANELRLKLATDDDLVCNCLVLIHRDVGFRGSVSFIAFLTSLTARIIKAHAMGDRWKGPLLSPGQLRPARTAIITYADDLAGIYARHAEGIDWTAMKAASAPAANALRAAPPPCTAQEQDARCTPLDFQDAEGGRQDGTGEEAADVDDLIDAPPGACPLQTGSTVAQTGSLPLPVERDSLPTARTSSAEYQKAVAASIAWFGSLENHRRQHPKDFRADGTLFLASEF